MRINFEQALIDNFHVQEISENIKHLISDITESIGDKSEIDDSLKLEVISQLKSIFIESHVKSSDEQ